MARPADQKFQGANTNVISRHTLHHTETGRCVCMWRAFKLKDHSKTVKKPVSTVMYWTALKSWKQAVSESKWSVFFKKKKQVNFLWKQPKSVSVKVLSFINPKVFKGKVSLWWHLNTVQPEITGKCRTSHLKEYPGIGRFNDTTQIFQSTANINANHGCPSWLTPLVPSAFSPRLIGEFQATR